MRLVAIGGPLLAILSAGCTPASGIYGVYDERTRALLRLDYDADGDGRIEVRTYLLGTRPFRTEFDQDGDGRIDRWEYLDERARVVRVGTSSRDDAVEDQWTWAIGADGERRVDYSRFRDGAITRREILRGDRLSRAEEDNNGDGRPDKWEVFEDGVLREAKFDTGYGSNGPDRRLVYDASGAFVRLETDPERDGTFRPAR